MTVLLSTEGGETPNVGGGTLDWNRTFSELRSTGRDNITKEKAPALSGGKKSDAHASDGRNIKRGEEIGETVSARRAAKGGGRRTSRKQIFLVQRA